jgi:large subunit ribosomal protein L25
MSDFILNAEVREDSGKGASRRLRRLESLVPGIVYGGKKKPVSFTLKHNDLIHKLEREAFFSSILTLSIGGKEEDVILKDLQRHPARDEIVHLDLMRVSKTKILKQTIPLHFLNEDTCPGVKIEGGKVSHNITELEVSCLPANLPEFIEVDLAEAILGQVLHISDIVLPKGVESVQLSHGADHDQPVVSIIKPKAIVEETDDTVEEAGESASEDEEAAE